MSERDKNREKFESMIANWNADFDKLDARLRIADTDPTDDYDEVITALRQYRYKANAKPGRKYGF